MRAARPGRGHGARIGIDHRLEVIGQRGIGILVHRPDEVEVVQRPIPGHIGVAVGQLVQLERGRHFPGDHAAINHTTRQRLGEGGDGHADGIGPQFFQQQGGGARRAAQVEAGKILDRGDGRAFLVHDAGAVHMRRDQMHVREIVGKVRLGEVPSGHRRGFGGFGGHERQLESLGLGEAARLVAGDDPAAIDHAITDQVILRRRRAAQLHEGIDFDLEASAAFGFDLAGPGFDKVLRVRRSGRDEVLKAQSDLLSQRRRGREDKGKKGGSDRFHGGLLSVEPGVRWALGALVAS